MCIKSLLRAGLGWVLASLCLLAWPSSGAAIWVNNSSELWSGSNNWSIGEPPNLNRGTTYITNAVSKVVTVDAATLPNNLLINALVIAAPPATTNELHLMDLGAGPPLALANNRLTVAQGGVISVTNSSLVVTGRFIDFNVWAGDVKLDSGSIVVRESPLTTNVTVVTRIGRTNAASLTINDGLMDVTQLLLGETPGSQYARSHGLIQLNGGILSVAGELSIGDGLGCTGIVAVTGGQLLVANQQTNVMRVGDYGFGQMTVTNAAAHVGNVSVARHDGARGWLELQTGGLMTCSDDLSIGRFSGATGVVLLAGGELQVTNHPIWVGREGNGHLLVSNGLVRTDTLNLAAVTTNTVSGALTVAGGGVLVSSNFVLGEEMFSAGQALVADGTLSVSNENHTAHLSVVGGTLTIGGGAVVADNIVLTNATGHLAFSGGRLESGGTKVSNGQPLIVGDGVRAALFHLNGGVHSFADGLIISANATLTGCGLIVGNVVNHGTIATNCTGAIAGPKIGITLNGTTASLAFESRSDRKYFLEFKTNLETSGWSPLTNSIGLDGPLTFVDPAATGPTRFYRLRVE